MLILPFPFRSIVARALSIAHEEEETRGFPLFVANSPSANTEPIVFDLYDLLQERPHCKDEEPGE